MLGRLLCWLGVHQPMRCFELHNLNGDLMSSGGYCVRNHKSRLTGKLWVCTWGWGLDS